MFRPLLLYNTAMGIAYVTAGILAWRNLEWSRKAAAAIFVLNLLVLGAIGYLYATGGAIAVDSLQAMILRTVVWLLLFLGLSRLSRRENLPGSDRHARPIHSANSPPDRRAPLSTRGS